MHGESNKIVFEQVFDRDKNDPWAWAATAERLHRAAVLLFRAHLNSRTPEGEPLEIEDTELDLPATLLFGYALEAAIKGYLIKRPGEFEKARDTYPAWGSHQLRELAAATGLPLTKEQKLLLPSAQAYVLWAGRYPISKEKGQFTLKKQLWSGKYMPPMPLDTGTVAILEPFFQALIEDLRKPKPKRAGK